MTRDHLDRRVAELRVEIEKVRTEVEHQTNALTLRMGGLLALATLIVGLWR